MRTGADRTLELLAAQIGRPLGEVETPVAVIQNGTTSSQRMARTTLAGLAEVELGAPAVIVVGPVAALGPPEVSCETRKPLEGRTVVVTRGTDCAGAVESETGADACGTALS